MSFRPLRFPGGVVRGFPLEREPSLVHLWVGWGEPGPTSRFIQKVSISVEDRSHDWEWRHGQFRYQGVGAGNGEPFWLVLEYPPSQKRVCGACCAPFPPEIAEVRFCPFCGIRQES